MGLGSGFGVRVRVTCGASSIGGDAPGAAAFVAAICALNASMSARCLARADPACLTKTWTDGSKGRFGSSR